MVASQELRKANGLTADLEAHHVAMLTALAHQVRFLPGETIFREGDRGNWFYFLLSGEVELEWNESGAPLPVERVHAGQEFGWPSLFDDSRRFGEGKRHFTAQALTEGDALAFDASALRLAFQKDPEFGYRFMRRLLAVVTERLDALRLELFRSNRAGKGKSVSG